MFQLAPPRCVKKLGHLGLSTPKVWRDLKVLWFLWICLVHRVLGTLEFFRVYLVRCVPVEDLEGDLRVHLVQVPGVHLVHWVLGVHLVPGVAWSTGFLGFT